MATFNHYLSLLCEAVKVYQLHYSMPFLAFKRWVSESVSELETSLLLLLTYLVQTMPYVMTFIIYLTQQLAAIIIDLLLVATYPSPLARLRFESHRTGHKNLA